MIKPELLAPVGDPQKLETALYFGADAVYFAGKDFGLRAFSQNFTDEELARAIALTHEKGKKAYVTVNIFARDTDFSRARAYFSFLESVGADAVIVSDLGLITLCRETCPNLAVHVSTQANVLNARTAKVYRDLGVKRIVLARELTIDEIEEIHRQVPDVELEAFAHGAMCISYSGRCLLSSYLSGRDGNRGACVQACRFSYEIRERERGGDWLTLQEDDRGSYILNSKDLNLMDYLYDLADAGVCSFKIEGRMKTEYYVATVVNAYRRALDEMEASGQAYRENPTYQAELEKTAHRAYTTGFFTGARNDTVCQDNSQTKGTHKFIATVLEGNGNKPYAVIEMRNRFMVGDTLEVLSPSSSFNRAVCVSKLTDEDGRDVEDAKRVQQRLRLYTDVPLAPFDVLRRAEK